MNSLAIGGDAWTVVALLAIAGVTLAVAVPALLRSLDPTRASVARHTINGLAVPAVGLTGFYLSGWQLAVGLLAITGFFAGRWASHVVRTRFPEHEGSRPSIVIRVISVVKVAFVFLIIIGNLFDLLRFLPLFNFVLIPLARMLGGPIGLNEKPRWSGVSVIAANIGIFVLNAGLILANELIWRFAPFEAWLWFYAYSPFLTILAASIVVGPIMMWRDAGEPGLRDP